MKFKFKIQPYQTDAVDAVVRVFNGQPNVDGAVYMRDMGVRKKKYSFTGEVLDAGEQTSLYDSGDDDDVDLSNETGYKNEALALTDAELLKNVQMIQSESNIKLTTELVRERVKVGKGAKSHTVSYPSFDVEMETGTGKTYVYVKTMFELNKRYGWSKFIVVVPSIAIREGVNKSFEYTADHFMEHYGKKARFFIYNSSNLNKIDEFSASSGINVMIINTQAFAASLKEGARNKESRIIYSKRDEFASRRPIDVIAANRPIIILDEPQKMGGEVTQKALGNFNPLFALNYSATHKVRHNLLYVLDALDAYNKKLVKKIEVKGFEVKNLTGTNQYMYLDNIVLSPKKPPMAQLEIEVAGKSAKRRETKTLGVGDNLYIASNNMEQYKNGYSISDIDCMAGTVTFTNGTVIHIGEVIGDVTEDDMRRIQIRETIASHFEKEERLFNMGIKTLSLFFIDEVSKYRIYDDDGNEQLGEYGKIFEEEYTNILNEYLTVEDTPYQRYLRSIDTADTHKGYFSIDKKTGHSINSALKRGSEFSDDVSAYDLIMKKKDVLLSFDEPTRFIFSHSALREGWDNPNVFQICTLKHSDSNTAKRQEVGRGLRLCVNQDGGRMDVDALNERVHDINKLTVIASESYQGFVADLQRDIKTVLYERPLTATSEYFKGKYIKVDGKPTVIDDKAANKIEFYLISNGYVDEDRKITDKYRTDAASGNFAALPADLQPMEEGIHTLVQSVYDEKVLDNMIDDGKTPTVRENSLNKNFDKEQFQELWRRINHKYAYTVAFDSKELIEKSVAAINEKLYVSQLTYTVSKGEQTDEMDANALDRGDAFKAAKTRTKAVKRDGISRVKYDVVGKIAAGTVLMRASTAEILSRITPQKFYMFKANPEEFITKVIKLINEQKATMIVDHIEYNQIEGRYEDEIFTAEKSKVSFDKAFRAQKHIQDYVFTDGSAEKSVERRFAEELDNADEVCVYAKMPRGFHIPTPVGNYSPDWAIAFYEGTVKHIYFVAETKGSLSSMDLRSIEDAKIECAKKLFNKFSTENVKYSPVTGYKDLIEVMETL